MPSSRYRRTTERAASFPSCKGCHREAHVMVSKVGRLLRADTPCWLRSSGLSVFRPKMFIQHEIVLNLMSAARRGCIERRSAMLWLMAYTFLLRVPSEALPMCRGGVGQNTCNQEAQSCIYLDNDELCLHLRCRVCSRTRSHSRAFSFSLSFSLSHSDSHSHSPSHSH